MYIYALHYKAEHKDARQYNANRRNLLVTPGAASFELLKLKVGGGTQTLVVRPLRTPLFYVCLPLARWVVDYY